MFRSYSTRSQPPTAMNLGVTIAGFILFLTGTMLVIAGFFDIFDSWENVRKLAYLLAGAILYKVGLTMIRHYATLTLKRERRRGFWL
ncbi:hypothetical protein [Alteromonas sp. ASW11-130]|uniref:hypothetical protein n=1 Tax=Alteromonas sp. ASW11-130 TaxID=3015775 RepID=UPI00224279F2|nr:hypothetical protein [Alteromonas sp. ASW11-130]MCW8093306.1 hypothetical protein [Alteromonas sp. ASW11-130]